MENQWDKVLRKLQEDSELSEFHNIDEDKKIIIQKMINHEIDPEEAMDIYLKEKESKKD